MPDLQPLYDAVLHGDAATARATTEAALHAGIEPLKLVQETMMPAMDEVGRRFEKNEYFVPELLLLAARAMKAPRGSFRFIPTTVAGHGTVSRSRS